MDAAARCPRGIGAKVARSRLCGDHARAAARDHKGSTRCRAWGRYARAGSRQPHRDRAPRLLLRLAASDGSLLHREHRPQHLPAAVAVVPEAVMTRRAIESDVCIIGSGISAAMVADKLARTTSRSIVVIEAGDDYSPMTERGAARERFLAYNENPWPHDH